MSRHCSVSSTPKQYLPVSWLISSKYLQEAKTQAQPNGQLTRHTALEPHFAISFFSWMNFTFARMSVDSSMACHRKSQKAKWTSVRMARKANLVEPVLAAVRHVDNVHDHGLQSAGGASESSSVAHAEGSSRDDAPDVEQV
jgi:hypothetical protein